MNLVLQFVGTIVALLVLYLASCFIVQGFFLSVGSGGLVFTALCVTLPALVCFIVVHFFPNAPIVPLYFALVSLIFASLFMTWFCFHVNLAKLIMSYLPNIFFT